jgi:hypothetical protein
MLAIKQPNILVQSAKYKPIATGASANSFLCINTNEEYHGDRTHISSSIIKEMMRSPAHCKAYLTRPHKETDAMKVGTAIHMAILEPHLLGSTYVYWDEYKRGKDYTDFVAKNKGKIILKTTDMDKVLGMATAVREYRDYPIQRAIEIGHAELSIYWTDPETGIKLKIRPDSFSEYGTIDIKKTQDARPHQFIRSCKDYGYDVQAAMYMTGMELFLGKKTPFYFLAVEEEAPHGVWVHEVSQEMYDSGMRKFRKALNEYKECMDTGIWPAYRDAFSVVNWPAWAN